MFQSVEVSELYYNNTYKIVADGEYVGVYKGKFWRPDLYLEFDHTRNISGNLQPPKYFLPESFINLYPKKHVFNGIWNDVLLI